MTTASVAVPKFCPSCSGRFPRDALFCPTDGTPLLSVASSEPPDELVEAKPDPYLGREISGHIEIRQLVGIGAMGRVYRAFQSGIDRDVAVKILHRELSSNAQLVSRFHREAKVASRLQHANVVHVYLSGRLPDAALYIVMEFLDGMSLQSALAASGGSFALPRALHIALQICDAVGEAHGHGVVHRDLKPENVMLVRRGQDPDYVKVLDFGIARLSWGEQSMATAAGLIFGTARYISPEGAQGEGVAPPGDVYAIATLLYQMLAGRTPFEGDQAVGLLIQQIHDPPPPLRSIARAAYVPKALADVIMQNLAKDASDREPDAHALGRAILDAVRVSGFDADDFAGRGLRLGTAPPTGAVKIAPMQSTKKMDLAPDLAARLASPSSPDLEARASAPGARASDPGARSPFDLPASAPTTKWNPPAGFQAQLAAGAPSRDASAPREARKSGVDVTLDDAELPSALAFPPPRTQISTVAQAPLGADDRPAPHVAPTHAPTPTPAPAPAATPYAVPHAAPPDSRPYARGEAAPHRNTPTPSQPHLRPSIPDDDDPIEEPRSRPLRAIGLVLFCFLVGVAGAAGVLYRLGFFEPTAGGLRVDEIADRADDALAHERWDSPPGDNVRDLTAQGLTKWPRDARLLALRARASGELIKKAIGLKVSGDLHGAVHLARLAAELDPSDATTKAIAHDYEAESAQGGADAAALLFLTDASAPTPPSQRPQAAGPKASLDASPSRPKLGQSVDFVAKVTSASGAPPRQGVTEARFAVAGPGLAAGTNLAALSDGLVFHASFSFLEGGRYEVTFVGRVDGSVVRATRVVVVDGGAAGSGTGEAPTPPPSASVKWL